VACCDNNVSGVMVCDGAGNCVVKTPPATGGPWILVWTGTGWDWMNAPEEDPGEGFFARAARKLMGRGRSRPQ
jgi:hypothetical protein